MKIIQEVTLSNGATHIETDDPATWIDQRSSLGIVKQMLGISTFCQGDNWDNLSQEDKDAVIELADEFRAQRDPITGQHSDPIYKNY